MQSYPDPCSVFWDIRRVVRWKSTGVSEDHAAYSFGVEEYVNQKISMKQTTLFPASPVQGSRFHYCRYISYPEIFSLYSVINNTKQKPRDTGYTTYRLKQQEPAFLTESQAVTVKSIFHLTNTTLIWAKAVKEQAHQTPDNNKWFPKQSSKQCNYILWKCIKYMNRHIS